MAQLAELLVRHRERQQVARAAKQEQVCVCPAQAASAVMLVKPEDVCTLVQCMPQHHTTPRFFLVLPRRCAYTQPSPAWGGVFGTSSRRQSTEENNHVGYRQHGTADHACMAMSTGTLMAPRAGEMHE